MAGIPSGLTADHVVQALTDLDKGTVHGFGPSTDYDMLYNDRRYPPKAVVGIAAEFATGRRLTPSEFSSGIGAGQACRVLHDLGFRIVGKQSDVDVFSDAAFIPGRVYRRRDLHERYGGQRQGGISTPREHPVIFLITGQSGSQYGYADGFRDDGSYWYTGEGQVGDMQMGRGNAAIMNHQADGKSLHLFEDLGRGRLQYVGQATYVGHHAEVAPDRDENPRKAIVFELSLRTDDSGESPEDLHRPAKRERSTFWKQPLSKLRDLAIAEPPAGASERERRTVIRERSDAVRVYVLRRASGICEGCGQPAPFETANGKPYLEPHHTRRLADGGPDHPRWVGALCPNCHARVHYGADGAAFNGQLVMRLGGIEGTQDR